MSEHACIQEINSQLKERNTHLPVALDLSNPKRELIQITTTKVDSKVRGKPVNLFASYCPFCGVKLGN